MVGGGGTRKEVIFIKSSPPPPPLSENPVYEPGPYQIGLSSLLYIYVYRYILFVILIILEYATNIFFTNDVSKLRTKRQLPTI